MHSIFNEKVADNFEMCFWIWCTFIFIFYPYVDFGGKCTVAEKGRRKNYYIMRKKLFENEQKIFMSGPRLIISGPRVIMLGPLYNYVGAPTYYVGAPTLYVGTPR